MVESLSIGWIGTGIMGSPMAGHLISKGYKVTSVYNRTASKADSLVAKGATFRSPVEIAKECDVIFLMLGFPQDVEQMVLGATDGILKHMKKGAYLVDHTTSTPSLAERIAVEAASYGVHSVDAPVSGGDIGAKNGCLVTMVGGISEDIEYLRPILSAYSVGVENMGNAGAGQHTKVAN
jgi:3-hydroxyisobutyrate dehydrogenase